jgi:hypothetical protein
MTENSLKSSVKRIIARAIIDALKHPVGLSCFEMQASYKLRNYAP